MTDYSADYDVDYDGLLCRLWQIMVWTMMDYFADYGQIIVWIMVQIMMDYSADYDRL